MKTKQHPSQILTPGELEWLGQWLNASQIQDGIESNPGLSHSALFRTLDAARQRVEHGLPPYGDLWQEASEEERRRYMEESKKRVASYND